MSAQKVKRSGNGGSVMLALALITFAAPPVREAYSNSEIPAANVANLTNADDVNASDASDRAKGAAEQSRVPAAKMSSVERINIRSPGVASLSGDYRINGDGTIALPGIGRLNIGEATIAEFETQLANEIQRVTNRETSVAVEVIEYRPVFVSGVVAHSGAFPWKPGYSILHLEALAGGLFRGPVASDAIAMEPTSDREHDRAMRAGYGLASTLASIERLKTEMRSGSEYILPPRVVSLVSKADQQSLLSAQQATLASRQSVFNAKVTALQNAKAMAEKDVAALKEQSGRVERQLKQRREFVQKIQYMTENRYVRGDRLFEEQVRVAELEERLTTTTIAISRAEVASSAAQQELESIVLARNAEIDGELLALEQKKVGFEMDIESANNMYKRVTGQDVNTSRSAEPILPRYEIVRSEGGKSEVIRADRSTAVMPGDVVVVSFGRPNS